MSVDVELRHGYTLVDLDRLARIAITSTRRLAMDMRDRYEIAWCAIVEFLYETDAPPRNRELVQAGWQAIDREVQSVRQQHGYHNRDGFSGPGTAPRFAAYWLESGVVQSHETRIVERIALPAVLAAITPAQRRNIAAMAAADGDRSVAAAMVGLNLANFSSVLWRARRECLALWWEHETPAAGNHRRPDKRKRHNQGSLLPCGTYAAARRHRANGEALDDPCAQALSRRQRRMREQRRARQEAA